MSDAVIVGVLAMVGTIVGSVAGIIASNKLTNYRIEQLEKKVDKHNTIVERTYEVEKKISLIEQRLDDEAIAKGN